MAHNNPDYDESDSDDLPELSEVETDDNTDDDIDDFIDNNKTIVSIKIQDINATYISYLQNKSLLLRPEYQRDMCWSIKKMNTFIDTIMRGLIVPNFVIYELSEIEANNNEHQYECIDGQHRLITIQHYIESKPIDGKYIYWNNKGERVYYNMNSQDLQKLKRRHSKSRNLTKTEKNAFDRFEMSFHFIKNLNPKAKLPLEVKCDIFNRLQNGERVSSWIKLRNMNNPITLTICKNKLLNKMSEIDFISNILFLKNTPKEDESFNIYFLIRTFLIIDKKNLEVNYLDMNIKKYLEQNDFKGSPMVQISGDINELVPKVIQICEFISKNNKDKCILPELAYIYVCIYANHGLDKLSKIIKFFTNNTDSFDKYNSIKTYKKNVEKVTGSEKITKVYAEICNIKTNVKNNTATITA